MSTKCWQTSLNHLLSQRANKRIAIVGVGNEMRGDDAAGMLAARALDSRAVNSNDMLILQGGHTPENATADLRKFFPHLVLLIDAADMGKEAGHVALVPMEEIDGMSASTHSLPLSMLARYLTLELNCEVALLGIQSKSVEMGEPVCKEVNQAVSDIAEEISTLLSNDFPNPASIQRAG